MMVIGYVAKTTRNHTSASMDADASWRCSDDGVDYICIFYINAMVYGNTHTSFIKVIQ